MKRFLSALGSSNYLVGNPSVTTLLNNLKKADSRTLAWPTSNERTIRSYDSMRREAHYLDVPFSQSVTSRLTLPKNREHINKAESDKSKFYYMLNYNESKDSVRRHQFRSRSVYSTPSSTGSYAGKDITSFLRVNQPSLPHISLYMVPSRPSIPRQPGRASDFKELIFEMLQDISFRKSPKERRNKRRTKNVRSNGLDDASLIRDIKSIHKFATPYHRNDKKGRLVDNPIPRTVQGKFTTPYHKKVKKGKLVPGALTKPKKKMPKRKESFREIQKKTQNTREAPLPLDVSTVHPLRKKLMIKTEQRKSYKKAAETKKESVDSNEMREYLKTIKKISPSSDSATIYSYFNRFKTAKSIKSSDDNKRISKRHTNMSLIFRNSDNLKRSKKKSQLIHKFELVNRQILATLEDPEIRNEFLRNIKQLASKEYTLFRERFMAHEKWPDVRSSMEVDRYLDHLDKTVRKARLSHQKNWKKSGSSLTNKSEGDDISQDIRKIEKMLSRGHTISKNRKLLESRAEAKKRRTANRTDQIGIHIEKTISKSRELLQSQAEPKDHHTKFQVDSIDQILLKPYITSSLSDTGPLKGTSFDEIFDEFTNLSHSKEEDVRASDKHDKYSDPIVVQPIPRIDLSKFASQFEEMPIVTPISYENMAKLTPEEFNTYFTGLSHDAKAIHFKRSSLKFNDPLTYNYRVHQVKRYLLESDMSLSDLDNMSIDDINMSEFLHYPYSDKYVDHSSESKISPHEPIRRVATSRKHKLEKAKPKQEVGKKAAKLKEIEMTKEKKELGGIRIEPPKKPLCCICKLIRGNGPIKDNPLIVRMKNEMKRQELKAYIREKQIHQLGIDQIVNDARFKFNNCRVLVPCQKPRTVCNQIYPANVVHRNNA